jgi:hypothetical protein
MTRSFYSGWVDRQLQREDRSDTMSAILAAFVRDSHRRILMRLPLMGDPQPIEVFGLGFMTLMFSDSPDTSQAAQSIIRHFSELHPGTFEHFREGFQRVSAANLSDNGSQDVAELRHNMMEAVKAMDHELRCVKELRPR